MAHEVELEIADLEHRGGLAHPAAPPQHHLQPRRQLAGVERLGQVIVAAGPEASDALVDVAEGADHQHRRVDAGGVEPADHLQAVQARQHAVQGDGVVAAAERRLQSLAPIGLAPHLVAGRGKAGLHFLGGGVVVFDDQDFCHGTPTRDGMLASGLAQDVERDT